MQSVAVTIPVSAGESVSGVLGVPQGFAAGRSNAVIVAHGAGNDMHSPLLIHFCEGLCRAGFLSLRFNFPYKEKGQKAPDPQGKLVRTWQVAFDFVKNHSQYGSAHIVAAGKSMGGRIASQMTAEGLIAPQALVFLGYPLHPPGKKEQLRDAHLYGIKIPMLFFAGTRDALCDLKLLQAVVGRLNASTELEIIEGGDHSFVLPKSFNRLLKNGASNRDPALCGFRKCSHMTEYAARSKTPHALADGPMLVFQHPVKIAEETVYERILQKTAGWLKQQV
jgi:predicted alpha/beta-hydrolase family hydrolase